MSRRDNADVRCPRCRLHGSLCLCALIPRIVTRTRLVLIIHRREDRKPTNTGRLATACLANSEVIVRGYQESSPAPFIVDPSTQPLLLFPQDDAVPVARFASSKRPVTLIVPDGTWRQASKVRHRVPGLLDVPCVSIEPDAPTAYRLRSEPRVHGLATMEAIARAFGVLEGPDVRNAMERIFLTMVERTLWSRGQLGTEDLSSDLPQGVLRHDPRGRTRESPPPEGGNL